MDPVRSEARKFAGIVIAIAVVTLLLFEAIAHRGIGPDAPGAPQVQDATTVPTIQAPGTQ